MTDSEIIFNAFWIWNLLGIMLKMKRKLLKTGIEEDCFPGIIATTRVPFMSSVTLRKITIKKFTQNVAEKGREVIRKKYDSRGMS